MGKNRKISFVSPTHDGKIRKQSGYLITILGFEEFFWLLHKEPISEAKGGDRYWNVSELTTGRLITPYCYDDPKSAVRVAKRLLQEKGLQEIKELIKNTVPKYADALRTVQSRPKVETTARIVDFNHCAPMPTPKGTPAEELEV